MDRGKRWSKSHRSSEFASFCWRRICGRWWESVCKRKSECSACCCWERRITGSSRRRNCGCGRRSEELHILNEIGRAMSSTLDTDALFETIYIEMRRLFARGSLYRGLNDGAREQIRYELEV